MPGAFVFQKCSWARRQAATELRAAGIATDDEVSSSARQRYVHFRAPDGQLYELVEEIG